MKKQIKLGDEVKDIVTGFKGIAISKIVYLSGCIQYGIKAKVKDGKIAEPEYVDESLVELVTKKKERDLSTSPPAGEQSDRPKKSW